MRPLSPDLIKELCEWQMGLQQDVSLIIGTAVLCGDINPRVELSNNNILISSLEKAGESHVSTQLEVFLHFLFTGFVREGRQG
jgi:hypothetical protein